MNAAFLGLLAPALFGQVYVPPAGGFRPPTPPIVVPNPIGGGISGRTFDPGLGLKSTLPNIGPLPTVHPAGNSFPAHAPAASHSASHGASESLGSHPAAATATRDEEEHSTSVAAPSGMVPPPPEDPYEPPPDGGDDDEDDDDQDGSSSGFDWSKALILIAIGGLLLYGLSRS